MLNQQKYIELKKILFLILFFKKDGFAFRYPMNVFFTQQLSQTEVLKKWNNYNQSNGGLQLYLHSIFCDTRCHYCDCESLLKSGEENFELYKKYLLENIKKYGEIVKKPLNSLYFGGGTFNLWKDADIFEICSFVLQNFSLSESYSWQVEIHPYYLSNNTLGILKDFGVTDLMLGIQTTSDKVSKLNNRKLDTQKIDKAIDDIIKLGFRKVSFDLMYNLPYMTIEDTRKDLDYVYEQGKRLKEKGIEVNVEINRWDISLKTSFSHLFLRKGGKEKFFEICKYYINNSKKGVAVVDSYIDKAFLGLFDTQREEIEERKFNNTAILGVGLSATSYIPGIIAYEDKNYSNWKQKSDNFQAYNLSEIDNNISFISDNLRRGIQSNLFESTLEKSEKLKSFYEFYKDIFLKKDNKYQLDVNTDIENDLFNLLMIDEAILEERKQYLLKKWFDLGFDDNDLNSYSQLMLEYYYNRNKLYG